MGLQKAKNLEKAMLLKTYLNELNVKSAYFWLVITSISKTSKNQRQKQSLSLLRFIDQLPLQKAKFDSKDVSLIMQ